MRMLKYNPLNFVRSVSSTNKADRHGIAEILLKVVLNTINLNPNLFQNFENCLSKGTILDGSVVRQHFYLFLLYIACDTQDLQMSLYIYNE
jgi:hypothetical protein